MRFGVFLSLWEVLLLPDRNVGDFGGFLQDSGSRRLLGVPQVIVSLILLSYSTLCPWERVPGSQQLL